MRDGTVVCRCPVGKEILGDRTVGITQEFFCPDCKWYYTFGPKGIIIPISQHQKDSQCNCGNCRSI